MVSMNARVHVMITGTVQGVYFRETVRQHAVRLGVKGWVRNASGGGVEALFEGGNEKILDLLGLCRKGPPAARVEKIEIEWEEFRGEFEEFEIRY